MKLSDKALRIAIAAGLAGTALLAGCDRSQAQSDQPAAAAPAGKADAAKPAAAAGAAAAGATATAAGQGAAVATLGDVSVPRSDIEALLRGLSADQRKQLQADRASLEQWLRSRLAEKALVAQAGNQGWADRDEIKQALAAAREQVLLRTYLESVSEPPASYPSEQELQAAYDQNKDRLTQPAQYRVSQIFLAAPYNDAQAVARARRQSAELVKRARAAGADFAGLAREFSQEEASARNGGDIGQMTLAQLVPELRPVVQGLSKGQVSDPVQLPGGLHIVKLVDLREAQAPALSDVQEQLRAALRAQRQEQAARAYLEGLINAGTVSIDGGALNAAFEAVQ